MPVIEVHLKEGRSVEDKRELVRRITDAMVDVCGAVEERVHVIIDEVPEESWGRGGRLLADLGAGHQSKQKQTSS